MTLSEAIFLVAVVCVGLPASRFNMTAVGLVASYFISQIFWVVTEEGMNIPTLLLADYAVIVLICSKPDAVHCPYTGLWAQLCALWGERTKADKVILLLFTLAWSFYLVPLHPYYRWWALWWIAMLQLLIAGWEGYSVWRKLQVAKQDQAGPSTLQRLAWSDA